LLLLAKVEVEALFKLTIVVSWLLTGTTQ
jgi:hypothetical protein